MSIYTLISSGISQSTVKVNCPGLKQFTAKTPYTVTVVSAAPSCNIGFATHLGTLNMLGNSSHTGVSFPPRILFAYNVMHINSRAEINTILITTAIVSIVLLMLVLLAAAIYMVKNSTTVEVTDALSDTS